jgi:mono/diheme cytochrome c family protein
MISVLGVLVVSGVLAAAQQKPQIEKAPIEPTSPADGREMFVSYCAACHGLSGTGNGPAAAALKTAPADLTRIAARNKGTFPEVRVSRFIEGAEEVSAHGSRDMPIWGTLFRSLSPNNRMAADLRVRNLTDYLKSIQR